MSNTWRNTVGVLAAVVVVSLTLLYARIATGDSQDTVLESISINDLGQADVLLESPSDADVLAVRFTRDEALAAVDKAWSGAEFPEAELARFTLAATEPPLTCLCWVIVVHSPGDVPYLASPGHMDGSKDSEEPVALRWFRIAVFDAITAEYYFTLEKVTELAK